MAILVAQFHLRHLLEDTICLLTPTACFANICEAQFQCLTSTPGERQSAPSNYDRRACQVAWRESDLVLWWFLILKLICEIMLVAEGFIDSRALARKFITLYSLCKELLSKQDHYDWGLRAIKSVLVVAGSLKRSDRERPEDQVLMRALRDFNIPKIVTDDVPIFMGLIGDLFPALDVPRKRDMDF
ncbi:hypothetical protein OS493_003215 [Desmophyllum pertusum]|uniref:Dynein heavy chain hydrolytic ATP-binding dynein motor region domain-containing protein n=1 Tax=Desmophyllum pertusum TaxID=174260 RepID=A0A9W9YGP3_9CNID|nr:hypothetical protein OS493_003215 [Desmophyllum pertusum]